MKLQVPKINLEKVRFNQPAINENLHPNIMQETNVKESDYFDSWRSFHSEDEESTLFEQISEISN